MSTFTKWFAPLLIGLPLVVLLTEGGIHRHPYNQHEGEIKSQSWDQENLKRNDCGCPTAIYVAPGGELKQCRP